MTTPSVTNKAYCARRHHRNAVIRRCCEVYKSHSPTIAYLEAADAGTTTALWDCLLDPSSQLTAINWDSQVVADIRARFPSVRTFTGKMSEYTGTHDMLYFDFCGTPSAENKQTLLHGMRNQLRLDARCIPAMVFATFSLRNKDHHHQDTRSSLLQSLYAEIFPQLAPVFFHPCVKSADFSEDNKMLFLVLSLTRGTGSSVANLIGYPHFNQNGTFFLSLKAWGAAAAQFVQESYVKVRIKTCSSNRLEVHFQLGGKWEVVYHTLDELFKWVVMDVPKGALVVSSLDEVSAIHNAIGAMVLTEKGTIGRIDFYDLAYDRFRVIDTENTEHWLSI